MARSLPKNLKTLLRPTTQSGPKADPAAMLLSNFNQAVTKIEINNQKPPSRSFHPSSMQCERNMFYQLKGVTPENEGVSVELVGICDSGTDRHLRLQNLIASPEMQALGWHYIDVGDFVKNGNFPHLRVIAKSGMETKLYDQERNVSFMTDGILKWDYDGQYYVLEIKTESSVKFYKRQGVDPKHYDQGTMYSLEFGIDNVIFLYESRDNTAHKAFLYSVTPEMREAKERQIAYVSQCVAENKLPPKPSEETQGYACTYCRYANACHMNHNGDGMVHPKFLKEALQQ